MFVVIYVQPSHLGKRLYLSVTCVVHLCRMKPQTSIVIGLRLRLSLFTWAVRVVFPKYTSQLCCDSSQKLFLWTSGPCDISGTFWQIQLGLWPRELPWVVLQNTTTRSQTIPIYSMGLVCLTHEWIIYSRIK